MAGNFNTLQLSLAIFLPTSILQLTEAIVSTRRIEALMLLGTEHYTYSVICVVCHRFWGNVHKNFMLQDFLLLGARSVIVVGHW